ncbi:MAG: hypothetical protein RLZ36_370 [Pseudomonadota bacterium]
MIVGVIAGLFETPSTRMNKHQTESAPVEQSMYARNLYALALEHQHGIHADFEAAGALYRKAADLGFAGSQNNLGDMYESGCALVQSDLMAMFWYTRAAERGEPTAYLSLANLMYKSKTDTPTLIEAMKFALWALALLPDGGNKDMSRTLVELLQAELSTEDIEQARMLAATWEPLYQEQYLQSDDPAFRHSTQ